MITVNGQESTLREGDPLQRAVELLGLGREPRGVAVALDGEVVPRQRWGEVRLHDGQKVEVVSAVQGG